MLPNLNLQNNEPPFAANSYFQFHPLSLRINKRVGTDPSQSLQFIPIEEKVTFFPLEKLLLQE